MEFYAYVHYKQGDIMLKKNLIIILVLFTVVFIPEILSAQTDNAGQQTRPSQKFAVVIGNSNYVGMTPLVNPVNDANDIAAVLEYLGFKVEKVLNGNLEQMEDAVVRLSKNLGADINSYGFFFYAGHGVQSGSENYLIPVNASIPSENALRNRAMSVQMMLDDLNDAGNALNIVVLDACRDNPFGWSRSGTRGLSVVTRQPAESIIVYATGAGQTASDGDGRNGLYTSQLINNLATPGLEVKEVFNRTGLDVARISNNQQIPAIYSQFFGTAFLGDVPADFQGFLIGPATTVIIGGKKEPQPEKFWSVGASIGSSFAAPWMIGTLHGTIAPFKYSFLELGFDIGFLYGRSDVGYYSLWPYAHYVFFWPLIIDKVGLYAGLGGGVSMVSYKFTEQDVEYSDTIPAASATFGANFLNMINISYTLRTNFKGASSKLSAGYTYRFK